MRNKIKAMAGAALATLFLAASVGVSASRAPHLVDEKAALPRAEISEMQLIAAGIPFGVKIHTAGVLIVGVCGNDGPAFDAGLRRGDVILTIDGKAVENAASFARSIRESDGRPLKMEYRSGGLTREVDITPIADENGEYKIGVWVKDCAAGIGTMTFIDPKTMTFAGLGHGICDAESGELVPFSHGSAEQVALSGITLGRAGAPGELRGSFTGRKIGKLLKNTEHGIYGVLGLIPGEVKEEIYPIGTAEEIKSGAAYIFTTVDGDGRRRYEVEISDIDKSGKDRNFRVRVTDPVLLGKTGGIVQGMSGSPIVQNGKLIGAITHVLVSTPTQGYGILIENMIEELGEQASMRSVAA